MVSARGLATFWLKRLLEDRSELYEARDGCSSKAKDVKFMKNPNRVDSMSRNRKIPKLEKLENTKAKTEKAAKSPKFPGKHRSA